MDDLQLAIKLSYSTALRPCVICGAVTEALRSSELFMADTDDLVCWDCGLKLAPELMRMLGAYWRGRAERSGRVTKSA